MRMHTSSTQEEHIKVVDIIEVGGHKAKEMWLT